MAYEVTATRRRPRSFDQMVGQEFVVATLTNSLQNGQIAHAYLFSGPRGIGKTSAARILARSLNCPSGPTAAACPDEAEGEDISRGTGLDVIEIDGASNTSVNDIRAIKDEVLFPPQGSKYKIYIIDEVHMLSNSAFNALLKTIEEPPPYIIFIFATTEIHKVPATIRSRCQQFNFRLVPLDMISSLLRSACEEAGVEAEEQALAWVAKEATGSVRDAYTLLDQIVSFSEGKITLEKIRDKLGVLGTDRINEFMEILVRGDAGAALDQFDEHMARGISLEQFVADLSDFLRSLLLLKSGIRKEGLLGGHPDSFSHAVQDGLEIVHVERLLELLLQVFRNMRYSLNPRFDVEVWISKAAAVQSYMPLREVLGRIQDLRAQPAPEIEVPRKQSVEPKREKPVKVEETQLAPKNPKSPKNIDEISQSHRDDVLAQVEKSNINVAAALGKATEWTIVEGELQLLFDSAMPARMVSENLSLVSAAVGQILVPGLSVKVRVERVGRPAEAQVEPEVQLAQDIFKGTIVGESEA